MTSQNPTLDATPWREALVIARAKRDAIITAGRHLGINGHTAEYVRAATQVAELANLLDDIEAYLTAYPVEKPAPSELEQVVRDFAAVGAQPVATPVVDLVGALRASVEAAKARRHNECIECGVVGGHAHGCALSYVRPIVNGHEA